jgi:hypothetical protein
MEWAMYAAATLLWANTRWALLDRIKLFARGAKVQPS